MSKPLINQAMWVRTPAEKSKDLGSWGALVSSSFLALDMKTDHPESFAARLRNRSQGGIHLAEIAASGHAARRGSDRVNQDAESLVLCNVISGEGPILQRGRQAQLGPGDFSIYQTGQPVEIVVPTGFNILFLKFPQSMITHSDLQIADLVAERIGRNSGLALAMAGLLAGMNSAMDTLSPQIQMLTLHNAVDLTSTMIRHELTGSTNLRPTNQKRIRFDQISSYIDAHLHDQDLSPNGIAAANFVSVRYLHAIFAECGETVGSWMRIRRLRNCARDLRNPLLKDIPIGVLSHRNGFGNQSYFSHVFKEVMGLAPAAYRAASLCGPSDEEQADPTLRAVQKL